MTTNASQIVQYGPAWCPSGYQITADGIPPECTDYQTLVDNCQREIKFETYMKLIQATMSIATAILAPSPATFKGPVKIFWKSANTMSQLLAGSITLSSSYFIYPHLFDPNTELPPPPNMTADGAFQDPTYAEASQQWYLGAQQNVSESLATMSTAYWDSIYLENEKQIAPSESRSCALLIVLFNSNNACLFVSCLSLFSHT